MLVSLTQLKMLLTWHVNNPSPITSIGFRHISCTITNFSFMTCSFLAERSMIFPFLWHIVFWDQLEDHCCTAVKSLVNWKSLTSWSSTHMFSLSSLRGPDIAGPADGLQQTMEAFLPRTLKQ